MAIGQLSQLKKYLLFSFLTSYLLQIIAEFTEIGGGIGALIMWMPTLGVLAAGKDLRTIGWKPVFPKTLWLLLIAWLLTTLTQIIGAALYFMVFPEDFDMTGIYLQGTDPDAFAALEASGRSYSSYVLKQILLHLTEVSAFVAFILGLGEEIGWRGFLYPELKEKYGRTKGMLLGGVIHGAWHFPMMLLAGYEYGTDYIGAPLLGLVVFCMYTVSMGIIAFFLYEHSGSILLSGMFHGAINSSCSPHLVQNNLHPERSIFGPVDIGLIAMIPLALIAAAILYYENKRERMEVADL